MFASQIGVWSSPHGSLWKKIEAMTRRPRPAFNRDRHREVVWERSWHIARKAFIANGRRPPFALGTGLQAMSTITAAVAAEYGVALSAILGSGRSKAICIPRFEAIYRISIERPDLSSAQIARYFRRDHTTVLNAIRKHAERNDLP